MNTITAMKRSDIIIIFDVHTQQQSPNKHTKSKLYTSLISEIQKKIKTNLKNIIIRNIENIEKRCHINSIYYYYFYLKINKNLMIFY
jgi:hypothetical protein